MSTHCTEFCTRAGDIADEIQVPPPKRIVDDVSPGCKLSASTSFSTNVNLRIRELLGGSLLDRNLLAEALQDLVFQYRPSSAAQEHRELASQEQKTRCAAGAAAAHGSANAAGRHPPTSSSSNSWKDAGTLLALVVFRHRGASCVPCHSTDAARTFCCWCRHHECRRRSRRRQALSVPPPAPTPASITHRGHPLGFAPLASCWRPTQCGVLVDVFLALHCVFVFIS